MKTLIPIISMILWQYHATAQKLETIYINEQVSTHFIASEPIQYVDISTDHVVGDMPIKNILRLKPTQSASECGEGIVTIVCQKYMVQFYLVNSDMSHATKSKFISSIDGKGLLLPEVTISADEMKTLGMQLLSNPTKKPIQKSTHSGMKISVNRVCTSGDYYFIEVEVLNRTNIPFEIDQVRFHVQDRKVLKSTNVQRVALEPEFMLYAQQRIHRKYQNVFVFKKFTFPNEKAFELEISEKQISGRTLRLQLDYRDVLHAEPF